MKPKTESPSAAPITFKIGIMLPPSEPGTMSRHIPAGAPSPFTSVDEVPRHLRQHIGLPPEPNYDVEGFRRETEMIQEQLGGQMSKSLKAALASMDNESAERARARASAVIRNPHPKGLYDE
jgi:hypothetical protein